MIDIQPALPGFAAHRLNARLANRITVAEIQDAVSNFYRIAVAELKSRRQDAEAIRARHVAMCLARELTPQSLPAIGRLFGDRDHTTVLHACRKIEALCEEDPILVSEISSIRRRLV